MAGYIQEMAHPTRKTDGIWIEKCGENIELLDEFWRLIEMNKQMYVERIEQLEKLCRRMYKGYWHYFAEAPGKETRETQEARAIKAHMQELGLLEGEQND